MTKIENVETTQEVLRSNEIALIELAELQLATVGGGCGDVLWG